MKATFNVFNKYIRGEKLSRDEFRDWNDFVFRRYIVSSAYLLNNVDVLNSQLANYPEHLRYELYSQIQESLQLGVDKPKYPSKTSKMLK